MSMLWYRIRTFVRHYLTAWNTSGEAIHSPYLFYLVEKIIHDDNAYYAWQPIEQIRHAMLHAPKVVHTTDFGVGTSATKLVSDIARRELESPRVGQFLFRLVQFLSHEAERPLNIVELGTSLGVTTAYLASPSSQNHVLTLEGSGEVADVACANFKKLKINNISLVRGNIDDTLVPSLKALPQVDVAYLDANHTYEATMRYVDILSAHAHEKTVLVLDDIYYSPAMTRAWQEIMDRADVTTTMDLYHVGLVFFDPHYLKRHYRIRL